MEKADLNQAISFILGFTHVIWVNTNMFCPFTETPSKSNVVETTECYQGRGEGYRGTVDVMPTGLTCQRWDSQYPHNHTFIPQAYPCKWVRLSHKTCIHSLTHLHTLKTEQISGWLSLCFPGTWEKTTVEIQMAKNSLGASLRTQESAQCSAPTSLSAAPKTSLSLVRDSTALFDAQNSKGKADFLYISSRETFCIFIFCGPWSSHETL